MSSRPAVVAQELRVLLRPATAKDAALALDVLKRAGIDAQACADVRAIARGIVEGAGAIVVSEEALAEQGADELLRALRGQPQWSDIPLLVLARTGADSAAIGRAMDELANVTVIERPLRVAALVSALRSALRARRRQYELRDTLDELRRADQRKTEFLATLAHELRNPLAPLSTALAILSRMPGAADANKPYYEMMSRQVEHMGRLVNDLLEVSRITRGKIDLRPELLALDRVIGEAVELSRPLLDAGGHRLTVLMAEGPWPVRGDSVRLTQVFSNVLNNAAKYTPRGGHVSLTLERQGDSARVRIVDNGVGIPAAMLGNIFDMFVQVDDSARDTHGGLGIGLTLVKSLVELHGGRVSASSAGLGQGTEVVIDLPNAVVADERAQSATARVGMTRMSGRILVVDDNRDAADSLSTLLQTLGASTIVAYDGTQALALAAAEPVQTAILDIGMPGMDGCELARQLRADPRNAGANLIALTGWGQADARKRIAAAGFDHHFLKPLDIADLLSAITRDRRAS